MVTLTINGRPVTTTVANDTPLLWLLRDQLELTGTKFGCGSGICGACTVLVNDEAIRACSVTVASLADAQIVTIEGLAGEGRVQQPDSLAEQVIAAWIAEQVPQCGYCAPGLIIATVALLRRTPHPSDDDIDAAITNLCRCGTYPRIRKAIHRAASALPQSSHAQSPHGTPPAP
jgi:isoquinoline 1-oxidoreductase alpha subunit